MSEIVGFGYILAPDVRGKVTVRTSGAIFAGARLARPPVIVAERHTNSLVIRARRSELEAIGRLLGHD